jgi:hypothetical protein
MHEFQAILPPNLCYCITAGPNPLPKLPYEEVLFLKRIHELTISFGFLVTIYESSQTFGFCMNFLNYREGGMVLYIWFPPFSFSVQSLNCRNRKEVA